MAILSNEYVYFYFIKMHPLLYIEIDNWNYFYSREINIYLVIDNN